MKIYSRPGRNFGQAIMRNKNVFELEYALGANGFEIATETTSELDSSPKHQ